MSIKAVTLSVSVFEWGAVWRLDYLILDNIID